MPVPFPDNIIIALGHLNPTCFVLAACGILLDLLTGFLIKGVLAHAVSSSVMRQGLVHKAWEIAIMCGAALVDVAVLTGMDINLQAVSTATCAFILVMELASVCENALEGNPELANAPVIRYVAQAKRDATDDEG